MSTERTQDAVVVTAGDRKAALELLNHAFRHVSQKALADVSFADVCLHMGQVRIAAEAAAVERAHQAALDERVDAEATGDAGDAIYNHACEDCALAIRSLNGGSNGHA